MFWKKKTNKEIFFEYDSGSRRASFRLECEAIGPTVATYNGRMVQIVDISAGGISFECKDCNVNETGTIQLELPGKIIETITIFIKIIRITDTLLCHCKYIDISEVDEEKIHRYILFRQIAVQRKIRSIRGKEGCL